MLDTTNITNLCLQKPVIEKIIQNLVKFPTDENKKEYFDFVNQMEYSLLVDAETIPFKSKEYFEKRNEAFAYRRKCDIMLLNSWVSLYESTENCPVSYRDTLLLPFKQIKVPK